MFKRRTSKRYRRERDCQHMLHLNVNSPRIVLFKSIGVFSGAVKVAALIGLLCLMVWGMTKAADSLFIKNEEYALKDIDFETNGLFTKQRVVEVTRIKKGATLFSLDPDFMKRELESLPEVVSAEVSRVMPNRLKVSITERIPVAHLYASYSNCMEKHQENNMLIGDDSVVFPCEGMFKKASEDIPVIIIEKGPEYAFSKGDKMRHEEALRAQHLVMEHDRLAKGKDWKLKTIKVIDFYTLVAEYSDGVLVNYGMYDHERQLRDLIDLRQHATVLGKKIQWLDLRPKRNIPGQYKVTKLSIH